MTSLSTQEHLVPIHQGLQASFLFNAEAPGSAISEVPRLIEWAPERWPVAPDWRPIVDHFLKSEIAQQLGHFMRERLNHGAIIYPPQPFRALTLTPLEQVKVVILGQDPYHGAGQAEGLAFSVPPGVKPPPSLRNVFKEIARDPGLGAAAMRAAGDGSLVGWARQGVLLLNTCLTVEAGLPASHAQHGWETLTDDLIRAVASQNRPVVFLLWGAHAQTKQGLIAPAGVAAGRVKAAHLILTANHPSPLSAMRSPAPFLGCGHFGLTNAFLQAHGDSPIAW
jgi:uracil-DNA glycosylase